MSLLFVLFHHGSRGDFFGAAPVAPALLRAFLDVFVLALLFRAGAAKVLAGWHGATSGIGVCNSPAALFLPDSFLCAWFRVPAGIGFRRRSGLTIPIVLFWVMMSVHQVF
jgi:hypothetical protein